MYNSTMPMICNYKPILRYLNFFVLSQIFIGLWKIYDLFWLLFLRFNAHNQFHSNKSKENVCKYLHTAQFPHSLRQTVHLQSHSYIFMAIMALFLFYCILLQQHLFIFERIHKLRTSMRAQIIVSVMVFPSTSVGLNYFKHLLHNHFQGIECLLSPLSHVSALSK